MGKAFRDEAVVNLPQVSNNPPEGDHGSLRLACKVKSFQDLVPVGDTICTLSILFRTPTGNTILYLFS